MRTDRQTDVDRWIRPPRPGDRPEPGYDEWVEAEIAAGIAELEAGQFVTLAEVMKEFGLEE